MKISTASPGLKITKINLMSSGLNTPEGIHYHNTYTPYDPNVLKKNFSLIFVAQNCRHHKTVGDCKLKS